ncbi:MAG: TonB-dependent receptor [Planctomycetaceae bacterium]
MFFSIAIALDLQRAESADSHLFYVSTDPADVFLDSSWVTDDLASSGQIVQTIFQPIEVPAIPGRSSLLSPQATAVSYSSGFRTAFASRRRVPGAGLRPATVTAQTSRSATTAVSTYGTVLRNLLISSAGGLGSGVPYVGSVRKGPITRQPVIDKLNRDSRVNNDGSYWVPARLDLDTALSKIDGRLIDQMTVVSGPYSARYGPAFSYTDVELIGSPRFFDGYESHGELGGTYQTNGSQWNGFKSVWGGDQHSGYRLDYSHRGGSNYKTGAGDSIPADYESREIGVAVGRDLNRDHSIEVQYLRLDQTDVDLAGQAFDIETLVTNGVDVEYSWKNGEHFDALVIDGWYNNTGFNGDAQDPDKRRLMPFYDIIAFEGFTNVESASTGYRSEFLWTGDDWTLNAGSDLRHIQQELDEITSGRFLFTIWDDANSPIPRSYTVNPGLFFDYAEEVADIVSVRMGARVDWFTADIIDDPSKLAAVGIDDLPYSDVVGTTQQKSHDTMWAAYLSTDVKIADNLVFTIAAAHAERPPNLTELYAAETFMFLLQNGHNIVTGDPRLRSERLWQIDAGLTYDTGRFRSTVRGYHKWINDYITFENMGGFGDQTNLKFVNTDLATIAGLDAGVQYEACDWLTAFSAISYAQGLDRTRNGSFATRPSTGNPVNTPSIRVPGLSRGTFSGITGADQEPLSGVLPLSATLGVRIHERVPLPTANAPEPRGPRWNLELSTRIVSPQKRVASSLLETTTQGFAVFDIRSYWQVGDNLKLLAGIENVTNEDYREHLDFRSNSGINVNQPGFNLYAGSELTY